MKGTDVANVQRLHNGVRVQLLKRITKHKQLLKRIGSGGGRILEMSQAALISR